MKSIDCRNMACPQPVVAVKRALADRAGEPLNVLLDAGAPRENVTRFAVSRGFTVEETQINGAFSLVITGSSSSLLIGSVMDRRNWVGC